MEHFDPDDPSTGSSWTQLHAELIALRRKVRTLEATLATRRREIEALIAASSAQRRRPCPSCGHVRGQLELDDRPIQL